MAALVSALRMIGGCQPLADIPSGECGNGVVELKTEDCECTDPKSCDYQGHDAQHREVHGTCYSYKEEHACRFKCGLDGSDPQCPNGWSCGADGVCRTPSGSFKPLGSTVRVDARKLIAADFDGDRRDDLMAVGSLALDVLYYDESGVLETRTSIPSLGDPPAIARLTREDGDANGQPDRRADIVLNAGRGVAVLSGQPDRTFAPLPATSIAPFATDDKSLTVTRVHFLNAGDGPEHAGDIGALVELTKQSGGQSEHSVAVYVGGPGKPPELLTGTMLNGSLSGPPAVGDLDDIHSAQMGHGNAVVFALRDDNKVSIQALKDPAASSKVTLPGGAQIASAPFLYDADGDGHLDLLVGAKCAPQGACRSAFSTSRDEPCYELYLAHGNGTLALDSRPSLPPGGSPDNMARPYACLAVKRDSMMGGPPPSPPLAIGDLNGDHYLDIVDETGVRKGKKATELQGYDLEVDDYLTVAGKRWTEAVIADFNGDAQLDVVAGSSVGNDLTFLNNAQDRLKDTLIEREIPTQGGVSDLSVGDLDGDLLPDVAFAEALGDNLSSGGKKSLSVCYGKLGEPPDPPIRMGNFGELAGLTSQRLQDPDDGIADLLVAFTVGSQVALSFIEGTGARQLFPAYVLSDEAAPGSRGAPMRNFVGRYDGLSTKPFDKQLASVAVTHPGDDVRMWYLPTTDAGDVDVNKILWTEVTGADKPDERFLWALDGLSVDLDRDGRDELVMAWPVEQSSQMPNGSGTPSPTGNLAALEVDSHSKKFVVPAMPAHTMSGKFYWQLQAGDLDGDQWTDIVAIESEFQDRVGVLAQRLVVFWNQKSRNLSDPVEIKPLNDMLGEEASHIEGIVFANVVGGSHLDADKELVVLTAKGAYVVDPCQDTAEDCIADTGTRKYRVNKIANVGGGTAIAACDILGDGVEDLAVLDSGVVHIYQGDPEHR